MESQDIQAKTRASTNRTRKVRRQSSLRRFSNCSKRMETEERFSSAGEAALAELWADFFWSDMNVDVRRATGGSGFGKFAPTIVGTGPWFSNDGECGKFLRDTCTV